MELTRTGVLTLTVLTLLTSGCASKRIANEAEFGDLAAQRAEELANSPQSPLQKADEAMEKARSEDLAVFSPLHWDKLKTAYKDAQRADLGGDESTSVASSALVLTLLDSAMANKAQVSERLEAVLRQKSVLEGIKAHKVLAQDFRKLTDTLRELALAIESGKDDDVEEDAADLLADMQALEIETMLELHWRPAQKTLDKAEDQNLDDYAPATFNEAERLADRARTQIIEQYQDREAAAAIGLQALRSAQHALYIGREAYRIVNLDIDDAEEAALRFEGYLHQISGALDGRDLRNMALIDQTLAIVQRIREMSAEISAPLEAELVELRTQLHNLMLQQSQAVPSDPTSAVNAQ